MFFSDETKRAGMISLLHSALRVFQLLALFIVLTPLMGFAGDTCPDCKVMREVCVDIFVLGTTAGEKIELGSPEPDTYTQPDSLEPSAFSSNGLLDILKSPHTPNTRDQIEYMMKRVNKIWAKCCVRFRVNKAIGINPKVHAIPQNVSLETLEKFAAQHTQSDCLKYFIIQDYKPPKGGEAGVGLARQPGKIAAGHGHALQRRYLYITVHELGHNLGLDHDTKLPANATFRMKNAMAEEFNGTERLVLLPHQCKMVKETMEKPLKLWDESREKAEKEKMAKLWKNIEERIKKIGTNAEKTEKKARSPRVNRDQNYKTELEEVEKEIKELEKKRAKIKRKIKHNLTMAKNYRAAMENNPARAETLEKSAERYEKEAAELRKGELRRINKELKKMRRKRKKLARKIRESELEKKYSVREEKAVAPEPASTSDIETLKTLLSEWLKRCCRTTDDNGLQALENARRLISLLEQRATDKDKRKRWEALRKTIEKMQKDAKSVRTARDREKFKERTRTALRTYDDLRSISDRDASGTSVSDVENIITESIFQFLDDFMTTNGFYATHIEDAGDLKRLAYKTPGGNIYINLPGKLSETGSLSGSVILEPEGKTSKERTANQEILESYTVSVEDTVIRSGLFYLAASSPILYVTLRGPAGETILEEPVEVATIEDMASTAEEFSSDEPSTSPGDESSGGEIAESPPSGSENVQSGESPGSSAEGPGESEPPAGEEQPSTEESPEGIAEVTPGESESEPSMPCDESLMFGQNGYPAVFHGPFDGNFENTVVNINDRPARFLAESTDKIIFENPVEASGPVELHVGESGDTAECSYRVLSIGLEADKLHLIRGEKTKLRIRVYGLKDLSEKEIEALPEIVLENQSTQVVSIDGGNKQTFRINPARITPEGEYVIEKTMTGIQPGRFAIFARLVGGTL